MQHVEDTLALSPSEVPPSYSVDISADGCVDAIAMDNFGSLSQNRLESIPPLSDDLEDRTSSLSDSGDHFGAGSSQTTADDIPGSLEEFDKLFGDYASFEEVPQDSNAGLDELPLVLGSSTAGEEIRRGSVAPPEEHVPSCQDDIIDLTSEEVSSQHAQTDHETAASPSLLCNDRSAPEDGRMTAQGDHVDGLIIQTPTCSTSQLRPTPNTSRRRTKKSSRSKCTRCCLCQCFFATHAIYKTHLRSAEHKKRISKLGLAAAEDQGDVSARQIPDTAEHLQQQVRKASPSECLSFVLSPECNMRLYECCIYIPGFMTIEWDQTTKDWTGKAADNRPYLESTAYNARGGTGQDLHEYDVDPALAKEQVKVLFESGCEDTDVFVEKLVLETDFELLPFRYHDNSDTWSLFFDGHEIEVPQQDVTRALSMAIS